MNPGFKEIKSAIEGQMTAFDAFKDANNARTDKIIERVDGITDRLEAIEGKASRPGRGIVTNDAETKAFETFMRTGDQSGLRPVEGKEMSIGGGASVGGAMVPEQIARDIIARAIARSPLAGLVRNTPVQTSDHVRLVNLRGATASWTSETGTRSATSTPQLREVRPTHGELYSYPAVTNWLLQDSQFSVANFLTENVGDQFGKSLESAILTGSGTDQLTGILTTTPTADDDQSSPERAADAIQFLSSLSLQSPPVAEILADELISLYFKLKPEYRATAQGCMHDTTVPTLNFLRA